MAGTLPPQLRFIPLVAGEILPAGKVYFYAAGTTTPQAAYAANGTTPLANPLSLDSNGAADFLLGSGLAYKINLTTSADVQVAGWPVDNVTAADYYSVAASAALANKTDTAKGAALVGSLSSLVGAVGSTLAAELSDYISITRFGAGPGKTAAQNAVILATAISGLDLYGGGKLYIPWNCPYGYDRDNLTTHPNMSACVHEMMILDESKGASYTLPSRDGMQQRIFFHTPDTLTGGSDDGRHDGNGFWIRGKWHPYIIISNDANYAAVGDPSRLATDNRRATISFNRDGVAEWQIGQIGLIGADKTEPEMCQFRINCYSYWGGAVSTGTNVFTIDKNEASFGFGGAPVTGINYDFSGFMDRENIIIWRAPLVNGHAMYFANATNDIRFGFKVYDTGKVTFRQGGSFTMTLDENTCIYGNKFKVEPKTNNHDILTDESDKTFTNTGATGGFTFQLPAATVGLKYRFVCTVAQNIRLEPDGSEVFRGVAAGKYKQSSTLGAAMEIFCAEAGTWEWRETTTWTTEG